ncbi:transcription elongation factor GreA [Mesosutterella sp. OilRF-GAM-744-9]|uniref:Transcription elongation factor GreA n=1 Tax=Mesosutterella porci TaxID=2915351 RepID=A0ABS9MSK2_9BURK|nr:transcription elongation factor GreA [Mesosutterella sp. oilRF-744-WT-GAM-9]MCG5031603.1 transcription elongation factor GreA [Mesosutterella sp. oilRF-744-WT-GAM-9]
MERIPITVAGAEKLKAELDHLRRVDRPEVVAAIEEARSKGDLSENAEYDAAREKQSFIEGRIALLEGRIPALQVIDPKTLNAGSKVVFGATVTLVDVETDKQVTYQVVGVDETDIEHNKVSVSSPIARALIGKSEGDEVVVHAPRGDIDYEILSVRYI